MSKALTGAVEVCPICDIAGCRHIRERTKPMTDTDTVERVKKAIQKATPYQISNALVDRSARAAIAALPPAVPALSVRYLSMPESNGRENWTAILCADGKDDMTDGYCFARSEYPDRVRYDADRMRYLIGETDKRPYILDYDADKCSDYVPPTTPDPVSEAAKVLLAEGERDHNTIKDTEEAMGATYPEWSKMSDKYKLRMAGDAMARALTKDGEAG